MNPVLSFAGLSLLLSGCFGVATGPNGGGGYGYYGGGGIGLMVLIIVAAVIIKRPKR